jgi:hypothetical protein
LHSRFIPENSLLIGTARTRKIAPALLNSGADSTGPAAWRTRIQSIRHRLISSYHTPIDAVRREA